MSRWTHAVCEDCWDDLHGGRVPHRVITEDNGEVCCRCGTVTASGIFVRADPVSMRCEGVGGTHIDD